MIIGKVPIDIMWSDDSTRAAFIVDRQCWGILDLATRRKLYAPRENGMIVNIPFEKWADGIEPDDGELLKLA